jgi:hypothetical protein
MTNAIRDSAGLHEITTRGRRKVSEGLRLLVAFVLVALISAGCSNASAGTGSGGSGATTSTRDQAVKFAECMRANCVGQSRHRRGREPLGGGYEQRSVHAGPHRVQGP